MGSSPIDVAEVVVEELTDGDILIIQTSVILRFTPIEMYQKIMVDDIQIHEYQTGNCTQALYLRIHMTHAFNVVEVVIKSFKRIYASRQAC